MKTIPGKVTTVNMETGESETKPMEWQVLPAAAGTCQECGTEHQLSAPHNPYSIRYQMFFHSKHDRYPTWADAMAHCPPHIQMIWTDALAQRGIDVHGGEL